MCLARDIRAQSRHLYRRRRGLRSDVQSRKTRIPAAPPICFPRYANYHARRVLVLVENAEQLKRLPPVQQNVMSDGPSAPSQTCCTLQYSRIAKLISIKRSLLRRSRPFGIHYVLSPRIHQILISGRICFAGKSFPNGRRIGQTVHLAGTPGQHSIREISRGRDAWTFVAISVRSLFAFC